VNEIAVRAVNSVWDQYHVEPSVAQELSEHFSYALPGAQHSPAFKKGRWDGRKKLYNLRYNLLPGGLRDAARAWAEKSGYRFREMDPWPRDNSATQDDVRRLLDEVGVPAKYERREHQLRTIVSAVNNHRRLFLSPTSSGKSMAIYGVIRWHQVPTLVLVPTLGLLKQLPADFIDYGCPPSAIHVATTKDPNPGQAKVVVSTWQTAVKQDEDWFGRFRMVIGDEAHLFKADSLQEIMGKLVDCPLRFGFTGTLDGSKTNEMVLRGAFGPVEKIISTMELVALGYVARPKVTIVRLKHPDHARQELHGHFVQIKRDARKEKKPAGGRMFAHEIETLARCERRNQFIARLAARLEGTTLVLFHREEHGLELLQSLRLHTQRPVHFINGGVDALDREEIRQIIIRSQLDPILLASTGTSSTGINIPNIRNVVFASPWKSRIVNLQSIGRGLRLTEGKDQCEVFDLADDFTWRASENYTLGHLVERVKIYAEEGFDYESVPVDLNY
jgi:superfamily II DNA or RNA helicase